MAGLPIRTFSRRFCVSVLRNSRMPFISDISWSALLCITWSLYENFCGSDGSDTMSSSGPIISVRGVRSSWVTLV